MDGMESFKPSAANLRAQEEERERRSLKFHNKGLHDEEGSEGINEATGKREKTSAVDGADEKLSEKSSELKLSQIPEDDIQALAWIAKEAARLEKRNEAKRKKAA